MPWIGPEYRRGGVVVLGNNLNDASGMLVEYEIVLNDDGQIATLAAGGKRPHGSPWAYCSARTAIAIQRSLRGEDNLDEPEPQRLVEVLRSTARLQTVKCSPRDGDISSPNERMTTLCPTNYLADELRILGPSAIVAFGTPAWNALCSFDDHPQISLDGPDAWRGVFEAAGTMCEVFWVPHPASHGDQWKIGHQALLKSLMKMPAGLPLRQ